MHAAQGANGQDHGPAGFSGNAARNTAAIPPELGRRPLPGGHAMKIKSSFCPEGVAPFDTVTWERRSAQIKDENGKVLFEQTNCEIPSSWSSLATNVVALDAIGHQRRREQVLLRRSQYSGT